MDIIKCLTCANNDHYCEENNLELKCREFAPDGQVIHYTKWEPSQVYLISRKAGREQVLALVRNYAGKCKESEIRTLLEEQEVYHENI